MILNKCIAYGMLIEIKFLNHIVHTVAKQQQHHHTKIAQSRTKAAQKINPPQKIVFVLFQFCDFRKGYCKNSQGASS